MTGNLKRKTELKTEGEKLMGPSKPEYKRIRELF
jgi:hypothetical protein